ncbi:MAG: PIN domain-containing protein [archaeon]
MLKFFDVMKVIVSKKQSDEAKRLSAERGVPPGDALHAILARDNACILITQDKHFCKLVDVAGSYKPEDLI